MQYRESSYPDWTFCIHSSSGLFQVSLAMSIELPITEFASKWLAEDQDPETRAEIEHLLKDEDHAELERRLRKRIAFGTAGLRSSMRAGYAHMNALTVLQASQGLADYVLEQSDRSAPMALSIVVGYDARHNSEKFARLAAAAFITKGIRVLWFGRLVHTPMVPFAVSTFRAAAGVMVTASHNPKSDNGYKVYWSNGCQIIPPHDSGIAAAIDAVKVSVMLFCYHSLSPTFFHLIRQLHAYPGSLLTTHGRASPAGMSMLLNTVTWSRTSMMKVDRSTSKRSHDLLAKVMAPEPALCIRQCMASAYLSCKRLCAFWHCKVS